MILLNDPVFLEAAQGLATRILRELPSALAQRIQFAFEISLGRPPTASEKDRIASYYRRQKDALSAAPDAIDGLYPQRGVEQIDRLEAAVWVSIASVILNMDEFITRG